MPKPKDNDDQVFSSIFKYFFKSPKKRIIRVCLNRIENMSLLCNWVLSLKVLFIFGVISTCHIKLDVSRTNLICEPKSEHQVDPPYPHTHTQTHIIDYQVACPIMLQVWKTHFDEEVIL